MGKRVYGPKPKAFSAKRFKKRGVTKKSFGLGQRVTTKLCYCEYPFVVDSDVGGIGDEYIFSANGLYDPNISGTGHQPAGFDQLHTFFDHHVVLGSRITVEMRNNDATYAQICTLRLTDTPGEEVDPKVIIENGRCKWKIIDPAGAGKNDMATLTMACNPAKFLGRANAMSDPDLKGSASNNPTEQCYWAVGVAPTTAVDGGSVQCVAIIEYTVAFIEPKVLALS